MIPALFKEQPEENRRTVDDMLEPLKRGLPVVLQIRDPRLPKKKRVKDAPVLMMIPAEVFGGRGKLVVALQAYGCEVLDIATDLKSISFARLGLSMSLSAALAQQLKLFYHGG